MEQMRKLTKPEYGYFLKNLGCAESIVITFQFTTFFRLFNSKEYWNPISFHLTTKAGEKAAVFSVYLHHWIY